MSSSAVADIIQARVRDAWTATPVREGNADFDPGRAPYLELAFPGADEGRAAIGDASNPMWEEDGAFMVHLFAPQGVGDAVLRGLADEAAGLFLRWPSPPEGLTIWRRMGSQAGERAVEGRPWAGISFGISYTYHSIG
jgi:hypothetical protein